MNLIYFLLLIGPLVFVHELGHFLMAKAFGIRVLTFSLGFGPVLIGRQVGETYYQLAAIPLGGFVKFLGDDPRDEELESSEGLERSFLAMSRWKRALVVFAGPMMSLILPIFCYFSVGLLRDELRAPSIGQVIPGTPAAQAGLEPGDRITSIDGERVFGFQDLQRIISASPNRELQVVLLRGDQERTVKLRPALVKRARFRALDIYEELGQIGVHNVYPAPVIGVPDPESPAGRAGLRSFDLITKIGDTPVKRWIGVAAALDSSESGPVIEVSFLRGQKLSWPFADVVVQRPAVATLERSADVEIGFGTGFELASLYVTRAIEGAPGYRAGIREGDKIVKSDGRSIEMWEQYYEQFDLNPEKSHRITVLRDGQEQTFEIQPERYQREDRYTGTQEVYREPGIAVYRVGVLDDAVPNVNRVSRAFWDAFRDTYDVIRFMSIGLLRLAQGRVSLQSIGGPIMLWEIAGTAGRQGTVSFLSVLALISVNLGLLNLLPVPVLDGGHLVILGIEAIRRRPLTVKAREIINIIGLALILLLMVYAFSNDIRRYWDWEDVARLFR